MAVLRVAGSGSEGGVRPFSACAAPALEGRIASDLDRCVEAIRACLPRSILRGIILGGGYGRGEGGVRMTPEPTPYNDYDLFVATRALRRPLAMCLSVTLRRLAERLTRELGVEVEIAPLDQRLIDHPPATLAMADLRWGHRVLWGPADVLGRMPGPMVREIPIVEATRLLMNRTALLVLARDLLGPAGSPPPEEEERFVRYVSKAWLASGDARLLASGRYHPSWRQRLITVDVDDHGPLALGPELRARYEATARQRLEGRPHEGGANPGAALAAAARALADTLHVVERARLGVGTDDRDAYRIAVVDRTPAGWKDRVRDLRDGARHGRLPVRDLRAAGSRSARLWARLPAVLDELADASRSDGATAHEFLQTWRSLP